MSKLDALYTDLKSLGIQVPRQVSEAADRKFGVFVYDTSGGDDAVRGEDQMYYFDDKEVAVQKAEELWNGLSKDERANLYIEVWERDEEGKYGVSGEPVLHIEEEKVDEMTVHDMARKRALELVKMVAPGGKKMPAMDKDEFFAKAKRLGGEKFGPSTTSLAWKVYNEMPLPKDESMVAWEGKGDDEFDRTGMKVKRGERRERERRVAARKERIGQFRDKRLSESTDDAWLQEPKPLTYNEYYNRVLENWRKEHPQSGEPRDHVISMWYDDYIEKYKVQNPEGWKKAQADPYFKASDDAVLKEATTDAIKQYRQANKGHRWNINTNYSVSRDEKTCVLCGKPIAAGEKHLKTTDAEGKELQRRHIKCQVERMSRPPKPVVRPTEIQTEAEALPTIGDLVVTPYARRITHPNSIGVITDIKHTGGTGLATVQFRDFEMGYVLGVLRRPEESQVQRWKKAIGGSIPPVIADKMRKVAEADEGTSWADGETAWVNIDGKVEKVEVFCQSPLSSREYFVIPQDRRATFIALGSDLFASKEDAEAQSGEMSEQFKTHRLKRMKAWEKEPEQELEKKRKTEDKLSEFGENDDLFPIKDSARAAVARRANESLKEWGGGKQFNEAISRDRVDLAANAIRREAKAVNEVSNKSTIRYTHGEWEGSDYKLFDSSSEVVDVIHCDELLAQWAEENGILYDDEEWNDNMVTVYQDGKKVGIVDAEQLAKEWMDEQGRYMLESVNQGRRHMPLAEDARLLGIVVPKVEAKEDKGIPGVTNVTCGANINVSGNSYDADEVYDYRGAVVGKDGNLNQMTMNVDKVIKFFEGKKIDLTTFEKDILKHEFDESVFRTWRNKGDSYFIYDADSDYQELMQLEIDGKFYLAIWTSTVNFYPEAICELPQEQDLQECYGIFQPEPYLAFDYNGSSGSITLEHSGDYYTENVPDELMAKFEGKPEELWNRLAAMQR